MREIQFRSARVVCVLGRGGEAGSLVIALFSCVVLWLKEKWEKVGVSDVVAG